MKHADHEDMDSIGTDASVDTDDETYYPRITFKAGTIVTFNKLKKRIPNSTQIRGKEFKVLGGKYVGSAATLLTWGSRTASHCMIGNKECQITNNISLRVLSDIVIVRH